MTTTTTTTDVQLPDFDISQLDEEPGEDVAALIRRIESEGFGAAVVAYQLCIWTPRHTPCCASPSVSGFGPVDAGNGEIVYPPVSCFTCGVAQTVHRSANIELGASGIMSAEVDAVLDSWEEQDAQRHADTRDDLEALAERLDTNNPQPEKESN